MISIIVTVYNSENYIRKCLDSCLNQTFSDFEVVCVNDGSTDNSLSILQDYLQKDTRFTIVDQENQQLYMARYNGVKKAKNKYIFFIDSDDNLPPDAVELLVAKLKDKPYDIILGNYNKVKDNKILQIKNILPRNESTYGYLNHLLTGKIRGFIWGRLIKKELWLNYNHNQQIAKYEDICANYQIFSSPNLLVGLISKPLYSYIVRAESESNMMDSYEDNAFEIHLGEIKNSLIRSKTYAQSKREYSAMLIRHFINHSKGRSKRPTLDILTAPSLTHHLIKGCLFLSVFEIGLFLIFIFNHRLGRNSYEFVKKVF